MLYATTGAGAALSLLCGAACAVLPQAWFALRMHKAAQQRAARAARTGMAAEAGKFALSAAAFAVVFAAVRPAQPLLVFAGFGALWLLQIGDSVRLVRRPQRSNGTLTANTCCGGRSARTERLQRTQGAEATAQWQGKHTRFPTTSSTT